MSEEPGRLRRAADRLIDAQREVLDAEAEGLVERPGASEHLEAALVDGRDILGSGA